MKNFGEFLNFCANVLINFSKFYKSLCWVHFCWMSPQTEILATPLQYRTWVEFMYEILFAVPPSWTKILAPPLILILKLLFLTMKLLTFLHSVCSSIKFYSVVFCIFYGNLYFTTFKKIRFPRSKILEPLLEYSNSFLTCLQRT